MIRRLAARGVKQKDIAEKVGLTRQAVNHIVGNGANDLLVPSITNSDLTVTAKLKDEVESMRRKLEEAEAARRSTEQRLSAVQSDLAAEIPSAEWLLKSQEPDDDVQRRFLPRVTLQNGASGKGGLML